MCGWDAFSYFSDLRLLKKNFLHSQITVWYHMMRKLETGIVKLASKIVLLNKGSNLTFSYHRCPGFRDDSSEKNVNFLIILLLIKINADIIFVTVSERNYFTANICSTLPE